MADIRVPRVLRPFSAPAHTGTPYCIVLFRYTVILGLYHTARVSAGQAAAREGPLQAQVKQQGNVLNRLSAEVAELKNKVHAPDGSGPLQLGIQYPGATEAPTPSAEAPAPVKPRKTPLIIIAPKPMMKFNTLYEKMVLEAASEGSEANVMMRSQDESLTDPSEKLKMLRKEEEEAAKLQAFYEADEAETEYATKEYPKGLLGRAKSFFHDLTH